MVDQANVELSDAREAGVEAGTMKSTYEHRRGRFNLLVDGVSYGGGQKVSIRTRWVKKCLLKVATQQPGNLRNSVGEMNLLQGLKNLSCIRRIVGFQDGKIAIPWLIRASNKRPKSMLRLVRA